MYLFEKACSGLFVLSVLFFNRVLAQIDVDCIPKIRTDIEGSVTLKDTLAIQAITCAFYQGAYQAFDLDNKNLPASNENILAVLANATDIVKSAGTINGNGLPGKWYHEFFAKWVDQVNGQCSDWYQGMRDVYKGLNHDELCAELRAANSQRRAINDFANVFGAAWPSKEHWNNKISEKFNPCWQDFDTLLGLLYDTRVRCSSVTPTPTPPPCTSATSTTLAPTSTKLCPCP